MSIWCIAPAVADGAARRMGVGDSFEITLLLCMQNAAGLSAAGFLRRNQGIGVLISSFVALYAVCLGSNFLAYGFGILFGIFLLWWLMAAYWSRVEAGMESSHTERCLPTRMWFLGGLFVVLIVVFAAGSRMTPQVYSLRGVFPSSGGTSWHDPFARAGVGDGDMLVAAQDHANTFGALESEVFLDSEQPSLYDMFTEVYGDPPPPSKERQRSVAIDPSDTLQTQQQMAESETAQREFSAIRRRSQKRRALTDRKTDAVFHCVGRVPLHLAIEHHDEFNGREWTFAGDHTACLPIRMQTKEGKSWAVLLGHELGQLWRAHEYHSLRIAKLNSNRFPVPPYLQSIHMDRINQADFYGWTSDGALEIPVLERIPSTTVVHLHSRRASLQPLRENDFTRQLLPFANPDATPVSDTSVESISPSDHQYLGIKGDRGLIERTASEWTAGIPRGWLQVEAITEHLRNNFHHDIDATAPEDCEDVVSHFLHCRSGPDYMFATTAAMLLRSLGYQTRLTTGFYVDDAHYERVARQTPVTIDDVHVWLEVKVDRYVWVPIEPTPGYAQPREQVSWRRRLALAWSYLTRSAIQHGWFLGFSLAVSLLLFWTRLIWLDCAFVMFARTAGIGSAKRQLLWTVRLLEWRARLARVPRPHSIPLKKWYRHLVLSDPAEASFELDRFLELANQAMYAGDSNLIATQNKDRIARICRAIERKIRISTLRSSFGLPPFRLHSLLLPMLHPAVNEIASNRL